MIHGKMIKQVKGEDGNLIGKRSKNPMLDTCKYDFRSIDG